MPRRRIRTANASADLNKAEKQIKLFRQWIAATKEAHHLREMLRGHRLACRQSARDRAFNKRQREKYAEEFRQLGL